MSLNVTIKSNNLARVREYKGKQYGEQQAALELGLDYPLVFRLNVPADNPFAPGAYTLDPSTFTTDEYGNLRIDRVRLVAIKPAKA